MEGNEMSQASECEQQSPVEEATSRIGTGDGSGSMTVGEGSARKGNNVEGQGLGTDLNFSRHDEYFRGLHLQDAADCSFPFTSRSALLQRPNSRGVQNPPDRASARSVLKYGGRLFTFAHWSLRYAQTCPVWIIISPGASLRVSLRLVGLMEVTLEDSKSGRKVA
ncbi:hypothetical protein N7486_005942 [Penicillium sp. IBT 16267x]|nr:hypothetical protein N7486_005942 [Penicillium sp. IBT 16267x]